MNAEEKKTLRKLAEAVKMLPPEKREYLIGYAEGVAAMSATVLKAEGEKSAKKPAS